MSTDPTSTTALDFAAAFLAVVLEAGPMPAEAVTTRAANVGISPRHPSPGPRTARREAAPDSDRLDVGT